MNKELFISESDYKSWVRIYIRENIVWYEESPREYPCVIVWCEYDIGDSMRYGWGIVSEFIYLNDFKLASTPE